MCHSRHCFLWLMHFQKLPDVIAGLEAAWIFFGGVPRYLVINNFPATVVHMVAALDTLCAPLRLLERPCFPFRFAS